MKMDLALVEPGALDARADGIGRLAHEQRFVAGDEIGPGGLTCEVRTESFEGELQWRADYLHVRCGLCGDLPPRKPPDGRFPARHVRCAVDASRAPTAWKFQY